MTARPVTTTRCLICGALARYIGSHAIHAHTVPGDSPDTIRAAIVAAIGRERTMTAAELRHDRNTAARIARGWRFRELAGPPYSARLAALAAGILAGTMLGTPEWRDRLLARQTDDDNAAELLRAALPHCDICAGPDDDDPWDWNGETGCHLSCEMAEAERIATDLRRER